MLNTDAHNPQIKKRMTKPEFIRNNRGINEGKDLPQEFLENIYDEIQSNEIKLKDEQPTGSLDKAGDGTEEVLPDFGKGKVKKEAAPFAITSAQMAMKTEAIFNTILKTKSSSKTGGISWHVASHYEHVKPMFQLIWMAVLTGISGPLQESEDLETVVLSLEGFKYAIRIICLFDMELEKKAFVSTLSKFTQLSNMSEMKAKNLEAVKTFLDIAYIEGNYLGDCWNEVVTCISQLDRMQMIGEGDIGGFNR